MTAAYHWKKGVMIGPGPIQKHLLVLLTCLLLVSCADSSNSSKNELVAAEIDPPTRSTVKESAPGQKKKQTKRAASKESGSEKPAEKKVKVLEIVARSDAFGKTKIILNKDYAYVDNGVVQSIHRPPHDRVYFLSKESGTCLIWETDKPYPFSNFFNNARVLRARNKVVGHKKMKGYNCIVIEGFLNQKFPTMRYFLTKDLPSPPSIVEGYSRNFFYDSKYGYPILVEFRKQQTESSGWGKAYEILKTRETEVGESIFKVPPFKVVKGVTEFAFFTPGSKDIEDLFEYHFEKKKK